MANYNIWKASKKSYGSKWFWKTNDHSSLFKQWAYGTARPLDNSDPWAEDNAHHITPERSHVPARQGLGQGQGSRASSEESQVRLSQHSSGANLRESDELGQGYQQLNTRQCPQVFTHAREHHLPQRRKSAESLLRSSPHGFWSHWVINLQ